ncbi:MAG: histidine phosphatase family protein [Planctomycetota bacterium]
MPVGPSSVQDEMMPLGTNLDVALVAAGPTAWDEQHRLGGQVDLPLGPAGSKAASDRAARLSDVTAIVCGPDEASRQTAAQIALTSRRKVKIVTELAEMKLGLWEGLRRGELLERCPKACRGWESDGAAIVAPGGESWTEVHERAIPPVATAIMKAKGPIAIVARPIVLAVIRAWLDGQAGLPEDHHCNECAETFDKIDRRSVDPARVQASGMAIGNVAAGLLGIAAAGLGGMGSGMGFVGASTRAGGGGKS